MCQENALREAAGHSDTPVKRLKSITIREVSNGFMTEKTGGPGLYNTHDLQSGAAVHSTPEEVANYVQQYLENDNG